MMNSEMDRWDSVLREMFGPSPECKHIWKFSELTNEYRCRYCPNRITSEDIKAYYGAFDKYGNIPL